MHIVQIVPTIEIEAAGPTYTVRRLSEKLSALGQDVHLLSTGTSLDTSTGTLRVRTFAPNYTNVPFFGRLRISNSLRSAIEAAAEGEAILHSNGLWLMPTLYPCWASRRYGAPCIISPHGMLSPAALGFSPVKKKILASLAQRRVLELASCIHATSHQEFEEIRAYGLKVPVAVVPNGIDLPHLNTEAAYAETTRTVLYLGRLHPKKGLDLLLHAWARVENEYPAWRLRIVGPSEGNHGEELRRVASALRLMRVSFEDALFGERKNAAYQQADVFVLPTLNENFGLVVGEALANGTPVICTKGAPWRGLIGNVCGWWIDHTVEHLAATLGAAMTMPRAGLDAMGMRGRAWVERDFSWDHVASEMLNVYRWCKGEGEEPGCLTLQ